MKKIKILIPVYNDWESLIKLLDEIEQEAFTVGAVNTIVNTHEILKGWNK